MPRCLTGRMLFVGAIGIAAAQAVRVTPGLMSDRALTTQASGLDGPLRGEAREELLARGQEAAPSVIAALRSTNRSDVHIFESGLNGSILYHLEVLGELGGPEAVAELRVVTATTRRTSAPWQRAVEQAATRKARARSRRCSNNGLRVAQVPLPVTAALTLLNARDELSHVKSHYEFAPDEEGSRSKSVCSAKVFRRLPRSTRPMRGRRFRSRQRGKRRAKKPSSVSCGHGQDASRNSGGPSPNGTP